MTTAATDTNTLAVKVALSEALNRLNTARLNGDSNAPYSSALAVAHLATEVALKAVRAAIDATA